MNKRLMFVLSIVERDKGKKLIKVLKDLNIRVNFQTVGFGTAPNETMDLFGLGTKDKDIVLSLGAECDIKNMMHNFGQTFTSHSKFSGIMIILDVAAASRILTEVLYFENENAEKEFDSMKNEHHNNLVVVSVNEGYAESVMQAARKAGATGGTVIKGRLADIEQFGELSNVDEDGDREMLLILSPIETSKKIMEAVNTEFGLTSAANGVVFALPTEKAYKI